MAVGRRYPPAVPRGATPPPMVIWKELLKLWAYVTAEHDGLPAGHSTTHVAGGSDALSIPGTPKNLGDTNTVGGGPGYAYEDHIHASGQTAKGDILTHNGTDLIRLAVGATDGDALLADSTTATGLAYGTPASAADAELLAWIL